MILSDGEIRNYIQMGQLITSPLNDDQIQPASIDLTLGNTFSVIGDYTNGVIVPSKKTEYRTFEVDEFVLLPNQFVLATSREYARLPNHITAFVEGRSSWGRLGLFIQNAGWIDPGFEGEITLELYNANRCAIKLSAGMRICQLVFAKMARDAINPYNGKYQKQTKATGSRIYKDFKERLDSNQKDFENELNKSYEEVKE